MGLRLVNARIVTPYEVIDPGWLTVEGDKIQDMGHDATNGPRPSEVDFDLRGQWLVPGFVDMHVHGGGGETYQDADAAVVAKAISFHRWHGTTTTMASLVTAALPDLERATAALAELVTDGVLAGVHLEGPFLSQRRCGAHDPDLLRPPHPDDVDRLLKAGRGAVRMVTLAPELAGGIDAVRRIAGAGAIAAVGHTDATYEVALGAVEAGATVATHLFNAMRPIHHREPGPIVALLEDPRVTVELIADNVHLHPAILHLAASHAGADRIALVTDAMAATGVGDGEYVLGDLAVEVRDGVARLVEGGAIAGSTLTMDVAFRNAVRAGLLVPAAARATATNPARMLGLADRVGAIATGLDADLVVLDDNFTPTAVMSKGNWVSVSQE